MSITLCTRAAPGPEQGRGVTLIELMVALALLAVLTSLAAPSFERARDRYRLRSAADALVADLQHARLEGIRTNRGTTVQVATGSAWCYGVVLGVSACDCASAGSCNVKAVGAAAYPGVSLSSSFASAPSFDARRGLASAAGTLTLSNPHGQQVQVSVSVLGLVSICSPSGTANAGGYASC